MPDQRPDQNGRPQRFNSVMAAFGHMARSDQGSTIMQAETLTDIISKKPQSAKDREAQRVQRKKLMTSVATKIPAPAVVSEYLTTKQAAEYLNLSRQYLEAARYRGDGSGPPYVKLERAVRYRKSVLDGWMAAHDRAPDKPINAT